MKRCIKIKCVSVADWIKISYWDRIFRASVHISYVALTALSSNFGFLNTISGTFLDSQISRMSTKTDKLKKQLLNRTGKSELLTLLFIMFKSLRQPFKTDPEGRQRILS